MQHGQKFLITIRMWKRQNAIFSHKTGHNTTSKQKKMCVTLSVFLCVCCVCLWGEKKSAEEDKEIKNCTLNYTPKWKYGSENGSKVFDYMRWVFSTGADYPRVYCFPWRHCVVTFHNFTHNIMCHPAYNRHIFFWKTFFFSFSLQCQQRCGRAGGHGANECASLHDLFVLGWICVKSDTHLNGTKRNKWKMVLFHTFPPDANWKSNTLNK